MFDQSFSAKNIEEVFNKENRKGNIDYSRMPQDYIDLVADIRMFRAEIKAYNKRKKTTWTDADKADYDLDKQLLDLLLKDKQKVLQDSFETLERQINNHSFSFTVNVSDYGGKQYFSINNQSWAQFYAMKILQRNSREKRRTIILTHREGISICCRSESIKLYIRRIKYPVYE